MPSSELCPKCNKPYLEKKKYNTNYDLYIHKRKEGSCSFIGIIDYCIVTKGYRYIHPVNNKAIEKLHPEYRKEKPQPFN